MNGIRAVVRDLEDVDEPLRALYDERPDRNGDRFVLRIVGVNDHPHVRGLVTALYKLKRRLAKASG